MKRPLTPLDFVRRAIKIYPDRTAILHGDLRYTYRQWGERLAPRASDHVLEIGSGWGGLAMHLARTYGCRVTSITVSEEQRAMAAARVAAAGLADLVRIELRDYRHIEGQYSRIVSVEMIEAVGREFWPDFFRAVDRALAPGGRVGLQAITMPDGRFDGYARRSDWIQKHIFPGGLLPCLREVCADLEIEHTLSKPIHSCVQHLLRPERRMGITRQPDRCRDKQ